MTTRHVNQVETLTADAHKQLKQTLESEAGDELEQLEDERKKKKTMRGAERRALGRTSCRTTPRRHRQRRLWRRKIPAKRDKEPKSKSKANRPDKDSDHRNAEEEYKMKILTIKKASAQVWTCEIASAKQKAADEAKAPSRRGPRWRVAAAKPLQSVLVSSLGAWGAQ